MVRLDNIDAKEWVKKLGEPSPEEKVEMLERIIKFITTAEEIRYFFHKPPYGDILHGRITLVDVSADDVKFKGYDDGLDIGWGSEPYYDDYLKELFDDDEQLVRSRELCDIWIGTDPWDEIQKLRAQVKFLEEQKTYWKSEAWQLVENPLKISSSATLDFASEGLAPMGDIMATIVTCSKCESTWVTHDSLVVNNESRLCHECLVASRDPEQP